MKSSTLVRRNSLVTLTDVYNDIIDLVEEGKIVRITPHTRFNRMPLQSYSSIRRGVKMSVRTIDGFYYAMTAEIGSEFKKRRSPGEYSKNFTTEGLGIYDPSTQEDPSGIVFEAMTLEAFRSFFSKRTPVPVMPSTGNNIAEALMNSRKKEIVIPRSELHGSLVYSGNRRSLDTYFDTFYPGMFTVTVTGENLKVEKKS